MVHETVMPISYCPCMEILHSYLTIGGGTGPGKMTRDVETGDRLGQTLFGSGGKGL